MWVHVDGSKLTRTLAAPVSWLRPPPCRLLRSHSTMRSQQECCCRGAERKYTRTEGSAILELPLQDAGLPGQQLDHLAHRHARRESVRVHDQIRTDSLNEEEQDVVRPEATELRCACKEAHPVIEWHVFLWDNNAAHPFLSMAGAELVSQLCHSTSHQAGYVVPLLRRRGVHLAAG